MLWHLQSESCRGGRGARRCCRVEHVGAWRSGGSAGQRGAARLKTATPKRSQETSIWTGLACLSSRTAGRPTWPRCCSRWRRHLVVPAVWRGRVRKSRMRKTAGRTRAMFRYWNTRIAGACVASPALVTWTAAGLLFRRVAGPFQPTLARRKRGRCVCAISTATGSSHAGRPGLRVVQHRAV